MSPVGWKRRARQQFSAGKTRICSCRTAGQFQLKPGMDPFAWKPRAKQQSSASRAILRSSRTVAGQLQVRGHEPGRLEAQGQTAVQCRKNPEFAAAEQRDSSNSNRVCTRSFRSPGPNSSSVQAGRFFAAAEQ